MSTWPQVSLVEVLRPVTRPESVDPEKTYKVLGAHWYAKGLYIKDILTGTQIRADKVYKVEAGDFVYNRLFAWKGSFAVATKEDDGCYVSNEFPCFIVHPEKADPGYLWHYFSRSLAWDEALGLSTGGTPTSRNRLKEEKFLAFKIPLPRLPEQRRIVARIEELAAKINEARTLRQQGAEEANRMVESRADKIFSAIAQRVPLGEQMFELIYRYPTFYNITFTEEGVGLLKISNLTQEEWKIQFHTPRDFIPPEVNARFPRTVLEPGDLVMAARGATIGKTAYVTPEFAGFNINPNLLRLKPNATRLIGKYFWYFMRCNAGQSQFQELVTSTAKQTITVPKLKSILVPLPSLPDQCRIVAELDVLQAQVDTLKKLQAETAAELDALSPSLLDKAFKGEL